MPIGPIGQRLRPLLLRLRDLLDRQGLERELDDELQFHIEREQEALVARGCTPERAAREARLRFGGIERFREQARDQRSMRLLAELRQDVHFALRAARHAPLFTAAVVLTLALGIGASSAIFTAVHGVLLRQLPFDQPDRLVRIWSSSQSFGIAKAWVSLPDLEDWRTRASSFERVAGYSTVPSGLLLSGDGEPMRYTTAYVTEDFFSTLGVRAALGRVILPREHAPGANRVVLLSDALWHSRFGGDPGVVGRVLRVNDEPFTVVGVMPPSFRFPNGRAELWAPLSVFPERGIPRLRGVRFLSVVARLRPGATLATAEAEMSALARALEREYPDANEGWTVGLGTLHEEVVGGSRTGLLIVFGAVLLVLALVCVNVVTLHLARATRRARELAVRAALGAGRGRIVRQLLTEALVLSLVGGAIGLLLAWWGAPALTAAAGSFLPGDAVLQPDWTVLAFGTAVALATGVTLGVVTGARAGSQLAGTLTASGRGASTGAGTHRTRAVLVAAQVVLAVVLVSGAALLVRSWSHLRRTDLGFDAAHVAIARLTLPDSRYAAAAEYVPAAERLRDAVAAIPGVSATAVVKDAPFRGLGELLAYRVAGRAAEVEPTLRANFLPVSPGLFRALGVPLVAGRDLAEQDGRPASAGIVVNAGLARRLWPTGGAIGQALELGNSTEGTVTTLRVVGVVGDARLMSVDSAATAMVYIPSPLMPRRVMTLIVRTRDDPATILASVRRAIHEVDGEQPITELATMSAVIGESLAPTRFLVLLVAGFGVLALVLASIGIYGVVAYLVAWRTREIGIRVALGARRATVVRWALRSGLEPVAIGLALGTAIALLSSRVLASKLYEVSPTDPATFGGVLALLSGVALLAATIPAVRAARIDAVIALREE